MRIMKCENCGEEANDEVCTLCGLVIEDHPIERALPRRKSDITTLNSADFRVLEHPLSPKIRKQRKDFNVIYTKMGEDGHKDYLYVKAYEAISKLCASLRVPKIVKFEALNLFKPIREKDPTFFKKYKLAPTYLACIKIACKIHDYPISHHDLASVIDYKDVQTQNIGYMEKKFNRAYKAVIELYDLKIKEPEHPKYIDYVCNLLNLPYYLTSECHEAYTNIKRIFKPHFRIEGYILAIVYLVALRHGLKITMKDLEERFHTSSLTISNRKKELENAIKSL